MEKLIGDAATNIIRSTLIHQIVQLHIRAILGQDVQGQLPVMSDRGEREDRLWVTKDIGWQWLDVWVKCGVNRALTYY